MLTVVVNGESVLQEGQHVVVSGAAVTRRSSYTSDAARARHPSCSQMLKDSDVIIHYVTNRL